MKLYLAIDLRGNPFIGVHTLSGNLAQKLLRASGSFYVSEFPLNLTRAFSQRSFRDFFHALESLLSAGVSLNKSLLSLSQSTQSQAFRFVINEILYRMNSIGESFSEALSGYEHILGKNVLTVLGFSEKTGNYAEGLALVCGQIDSRRKLRKEIMQISGQILLIGAFVLTTFISLLIMLVPQIKVFFAQNNIVPSEGTALIIGASEAMAALDAWPIFFSLGVFIGIGYAIKRVQHLVLGRSDKKIASFFQKFMMTYVPLYRSYVRCNFWGYLTRFTKAKISITQAILACVEGINEGSISIGASKIYRQISQGKTVADAFLNSDFASSRNREILATFCNTGDIATAICEVHKIEELEFEARVKQIKLGLYPAGLTILAMSILWMIYVILAPVYQSVGVLIS